MERQLERTEFRDVNGLAVYERGEGETTLVMPYSHAYTTSPMVEGTLAEMLAAMGRRVLTFDPPGSYRSTRPAQMDVAEMVGCACETLDAFGMRSPVDVVGHSMGAFCAAVFSAENPNRVRRLALVSPCGLGDPSKMRALPFGMTDSRFWRFYRYAIPVYMGRGTLGQHRALYDLLVPALHADPSKVDRLQSGDADDAAPAPPRAAMLKGVPKVRREYLSRIAVPTLVATGSADAMIPVRLAENLRAWIPDARLVVFDACGHYPQEETPEELRRALADFLR